MTRTTPELGHPTKEPKANNIVSKKEVEAFLEERGKPLTRKNRRRARNRLQRKKDRSLLPRGVEVAINQSDAPQQILYGAHWIGGVYAFAHSYVDGTRRSYFVVNLLGHEIDSIQLVKFDDNIVSFPAEAGPTIDAWANGGTRPDGTEIDYTDKVYIGVNLGGDDQTAIAQAVIDLATNSLWTANHRGRAIAHAYIKLLWDPNLFGEGLPEMSFLVKGKKLYDPRTETTAWSANSALCIYDFLLDPIHGLGNRVDASMLNLASFEAAADVCDEDVDLAGGGAENRYEFHMRFESGEDKQAILDEMLASCSGRLYESQGKYKLKVGKYYSPTVTLTASDIRGTLTYNEHMDSGDIFNGVRGTHTSAADDYKVKDYPSLLDPDAVTEDGGIPIYAEIDYPGVVSGAQCQRLALIALKKVRYQREVSAPFSPRKAFALEEGDVVNFTLDALNLELTPFEVDDRALVYQSDGTFAVDLVLQEINEAVFDDEEEIVYSTPPNLNHPQPTDVATVADLTLESGTDHLYLKADGTIVSRIYVSWTLPTDEFILDGGHTVVEYKRTAESSWSAAQTVDGAIDHLYLWDVEDGESYDVRAKHVNVISIPGATATATGHTVVGKTEPPSDVASLTHSFKNFRTVFSWPGISDLDRSHYILKRGGTDWGNAELVQDNIKDTVFIDDHQPAGVTTYRLKAVDTSGNESDVAATEEVTIIGPNTIQNFRPKVTGNNVLLDWDAPVASTLPIAQYHVYKGDVFATAEEIGTVSGTFITYLEQTGGTFTYWIVAEDRAGNLGDAVSEELVVTEPDDFYIKDDTELTNYYVESRKAIIGGSFYARGEEPGTYLLPIASTEADTASLPLPFGSSPEYFETWEGHFSPGYDSFQDLIDAGYTHYLQPTTTEPGKIVWQINYGVTFSSSFIDFSWVEESIDGSVTFTPTIEYSPDAETWTEHEGSAQVFAEDFGHGRFTLAFQGDSDKALSKLTNVRVKLSLKIEEEEDIVDILAADSGGTYVPFTKEYLDIRSIQLTAVGSSAMIPVLVFEDVPDPEGFRVLGFDVEGDRVNGKVRYVAKGAVNPA